MAKQAPVRPWSSLFSLRSAPAPPPPPAPPTLKTASTPPSPPSQSPEATAGASARASPPQNVADASKPRNTSSPHKHDNVTKSVPPTTAPTVHSLRHSQNHKLMINPPPSSKLNANNPEIDQPKIPVEEELKTVQQVNKTIENKPKVNGNGSLQKGLDKKLSHFEDSGSIRVITISGENKGAYMDITQSRKKPNHLIHKMGNSKNKAYELEKSVNSGEGNNANWNKDKNHKVRTVSTSFPIAGVYMNSNVQCVNNSLMLHTSCTHHDPGVHFNLSKKPFDEGFHIKEQRN